MVSFTLQIAKIWRERDASSVVLRMYVVTAVAASPSGPTYGALTHSWPVIGLERGVPGARPGVILGARSGVSATDKRAIVGATAQRRLQLPLA